MLTALMGQKDYIDAKLTEMCLMTKPQILGKGQRQ